MKTSEAGETGIIQTELMGTAKEVPSLAKVYEKYFNIGTCVELSQLMGTEGELLLKHFSSLTAENIMKPKYMAPSEGTFTFDNADKLVNYALENNKLVRGHTLVWHNQNAKWMFYDQNGNKVSKNVLLKRLETYINTVVSRYKGKVYAWDVVNEVVDATALRKSEWLEIAGEEYIEKAFIYAHRADPGARLFLNEIDTIERIKSENICKLVRKLLDRNVPIHGIGLQFHITLHYPGLQAISEALKKYNDLGLEIHITEFDMSLNADPDFKAGKAPEDLLIRQAHRYKEIFDLFKTYKNITNVTFWGFHDGHTWSTYFPVTKKDWPLLFDRDFKTKYAFWGLVDPSRLPKDVVINNDSKNNFKAYAKKGTPVIDGMEDEIWKKTGDMNITIYVQGSGSHGTGKTLCYYG
ncbi:MAG: endo-1,4-beta-xylanase [Spirochaetales bacterium]|nr:endo-1,4-beta-xylanase [Spirochaetales bacterium]